MRHYFVCFRVEDDNGMGVNNAEIRRATPVTSYDDIKDMEQEIIKITGFRNVIILNWRKFEDAI